jgi:hypothetical protein
MYNFKNYSLILEMANNLNKIKTIANIPEIYDWCMQKDKKLSYWIAKQLINKLFSLDVNFVKVNRDKIKTWLKEGSFPDDKTTRMFYDAFETAKGIIEPSINEVLSWVNSPLHTNKPSVRNLTLDQAVEKSRQWHKEIEEAKEKESEILRDETSGKIIKTYPDGYYWIDLQKNSDSDEAENMGHCATTSEGTTLLSLRDKDKQSHITISFDEDENKFCQIKGRRNSKPKPEYHSYIVDIIIDLKVEGYKTEYASEVDFHVNDLSDELRGKLEKENPDYINGEEEEKSIEELESEAKDYFEDMDFVDFVNNYASMWYVWQNINDREFCDSFLDNEKEYWSDNINDLGWDADKIAEWIDNSIKTDQLKEYFENNPGYSSEEEETYLDILEGMSKEDLIILIKHFNYESDLANDYIDEIYGDMDAEELLGEFGFTDMRSGEMSRELYNTISYYIDEGGIISEYVDNLDGDSLRNIMG